MPMENKNSIPVGYLINCDLLQTMRSFLLVKHILNPLGLAKYEILQHDKVVAEIKYVDGRIVRSCC
jgi:hypothetical protein